MKKILKPLLVAAALTLGGGVAHAQGGGTAPGSGAPAGPGYTAENLTVRNGGDSTERDAARAREDALAKMRLEERSGKSGKTLRQVPAQPEDVTVGAEVRDKKGLRVGAIEAVSMGSAVLKADGGAVEVPLEALGKDSKGLLIGLTKAEFDKLVAEANKPVG
jgi:hypothetical protein